MFLFGVLVGFIFVVFWIIVGGIGCLMGSDVVII